MSLKASFNNVIDLINNPGTETARKLNDSEEFRRYFEKYKAFKSEALDGAHGKTAQFWSRYMTEYYSDHSYSKQSYKRKQS